MRVLFAGTPAVAVAAFEAVRSSGHDLRGVLTRPPAPVGRRRVLTPSPVHAAADAAGLPVLTQSPTSPEVLDFLAAERIDVVAVVAYGALIREPALSAPPHGWVNLHFSKLPKWRGAAPVQYAIMARETETGISTFQIEAGLDTGPVFDQLTEPISEVDTAADLLERLAASGAPLLVSTLDAIAAGTAHSTPQAGEVTLAPTLHHAHGQVDWSGGAEAVSAQIRGLTPAPGAWSTAEIGRFKLGPVTLVDGEALSEIGTLTPGEVSLSSSDVIVGTGSTPVRLDRLAPPGKPWMAALDWARGARLDSLRFEALP